MPDIIPFLWFDVQAEEAARFYTSFFPRSRITSVNRFGKGGPAPEGSVMACSFELDGKAFTALNGGPAHAFTEAVSFLIACKDQKEIDFYWEKLTAEGGAPGRCGWLQDRFGVSWQVVPERMGELLRTPAAMQAMLGMSKLDIATLEAASR
jgi:predicted 3-demethylubiquinone-9 3-methyltransferase (glyoxalase superfamily)